MTVFLVGAGPGDPGLLTVRGAEVLRRADVVVYDRLSVAALLDLAPPAAERIPVGKAPGRVTMPQDDINALLVARGASGQTVVRLKGGDPFVFARGGEEAAALAAAGVPFEIVPGITSAIAVPAYAGIPVTLRHSSTSFTVVTEVVPPIALVDSILRVPAWIVLPVVLVLFAPNTSVPFPSLASPSVMLSVDWMVAVTPSSTVMLFPDAWATVPPLNV